MKTNRHFFIVRPSFLLRMRNVSEKICREKQNIHFVFSNFFFPRIIMPCMRQCEKIQGVFKKRPNFCYKDFIALFTEF